MKEKKAITHPQAWETYAFRTSDGRIMGIFQVQDISSFNKMQMEVWVAQ
jgi:hypothetical protein